MLYDLNLLRLLRHRFKKCTLELIKGPAPSLNRSNLGYEIKEHLSLQPPRLR